MTTDHPITLPPELVQRWRNAAPPLGLNRESWIATAAARWGSDQELEACCEWVEREIGHGREWGAELRASRRPSPPSLKEQALAALDEEQAEMSIVNYKTIRAVLEQLND